jgi:3-hydroxyacyl-CoA dehydrogenase/enoyl-CoA hydratase/3-hydroxybutyryl-CoA epimerase
MTGLNIEIRESGVAVLTIDQPGSSVNTLSRAAMQELDRAFDRLLGDVTLRGLVITSGKPGCFVAGADITEIRQMQETLDETSAFEATQLGKKIFSKLRAMPFATVAAIDGVAYGGGLELACYATYRLATRSSKTRLGFLEAWLGLIPGWGLTVMLKDLIGLKKAIELVTAGSRLTAEDAWKIGLVDELVSDSIIDRAEEVLLTGKISRYQPSVDAQMERWFFNNTLLGRYLVFNGLPFGLLGQKGAIEIVARRSKGLLAPGTAVQVMRDSLRKPGRALENESLQFARLAMSSVSKNLVEMFFAKERAKKLPAGLTIDHQISRVGVIGMGVMGAPITQLLAYNGYDVVAVDISEDAVNKGLQAIEGLLAGLVKDGKINQVEADAMRNRIKATTDYADLDGCEAIIEAATENLAVKQRILALCEASIKNEFYFFSNTSSKSITKIAAKAANPLLVGGIHFFNPPQTRETVEIIRGAQTADQTVAAAYTIVTRLGKVPAQVADHAGFVVNAILGPGLQQVFKLIAMGVSPIDIDKAITAFGMPGPCQVIDLVGIDICLEVLKTLETAYGERLAVPELLSWIEEHNNSLSQGDEPILGQKSGAGIFLYDSDGKRLFDQKAKRYAINPQILAWVSEIAPEAKPPRISAKHIQDRLVMAMVAEAIRCLERGAIADPAMLDLIYVLSTGFAPGTGGPLHYADSQGLLTVMRRLEILEQGLGENYAVPDLLRNMVEQGQMFFPPKRCRSAKQAQKVGS